MENNNAPNEILLEAGTNELEIMEFVIDDQLYGINVAKVREIMMISPVISMQKSHPHIEGVFKPRDKVITVVDLAKYLGLGESKNPSRDIFIITNFNNLDFAFHVHSIVGIDRIYWSQMRKPDSLIYGGDEGVATSIAEFEGRLITILDIEKIIAEISPATGIQVSDIEQLGDRERSDKTVLICEDSMLLSKLIIESLQKAGYVNIIKTENGKEAWDYLETLRKYGKDIHNHVSCIVSDIEMPQIDGHRLTKLVKTDNVLKNIPLILFSSLISDEMRVKGKQLGADDQITKPEIVKLVNIIDRLTKDQ